MPNLQGVLKVLVLAARSLATRRQAEDEGAELGHADRPWRSHDIGSGRGCSRPGPDRRRWWWRRWRWRRHHCTGGEGGNHKRWGRHWHRGRRGCTSRSWWRLNQKGGRCIRLVLGPPCSRSAHYTSRRMAVETVRQQAARRTELALALTEVFDPMEDLRGVLGMSIRASVASLTVLCPCVFELQVGHTDGLAVGDWIDLVLRRRSRARRVAIEAERQQPAHKSEFAVPLAEISCPVQELRDVIGVPFGTSISLGARWSSTLLVLNVRHAHGLPRPERDLQRRRRHRRRSFCL
mmetsp:Transcript_51445/g.166816  ORF Transcript_51445/g.166816 Transcript_51445/m.166816 type:complete len:292 (+) Transcript_51445:970-1845(+)